MCFCFLQRSCILVVVFFAIISDTHFTETQIIGLIMSFWLLERHSDSRRATGQRRVMTHSEVNNGHSVHMQQVMELYAN